MIKIYGETPELNLPNNADLDDVLSTMEELDGIYKARSEQNAEYITVHRDTLFSAFLYVKDNLDRDNEKVLIEVINLWDKLSDEQKDIIISSLKPLIAEHKIEEDKIYTWYEKVK